MTTVFVFVLFEILLCMVVRFWYFFATQRNVVARTRVAIQYASNARITMNAVYGRNFHFLCFGENLSKSLMEKNVKFVLNDVKATAFSGSKRRHKSVDSRSAGVAKQRRT